MTSPSKNPTESHDVVHCLIQITCVKELSTNKTNTKKSDMLHEHCTLCINPQGGPPHMRGVGMLVVSLRGVLGKTPSYLAVKVSFRVVREKIKEIYI